MGFWSSLLKYSGSAAKATGKSVGNAVLNPTRTVQGAGKAMKTAAIGAGAGYVGWEKLTTDKSVVRIVSDAVVGESATDKISEATDDIKALKTKAGEAIDSVNQAMGNMDSKWSGMTNFFQGLFSGNGMNMFSNFFNNLSKGNVSGLSLVGLVAAAYLVFGRSGWLSRIAGTMLALMMIGNNSNMDKVLHRESKEPEREQIPDESQTKGMRR